MTIADALARANLANEAHVPDTAALADMLDSARARTLRYVSALDAAGGADERWRGPYLGIVNPPLWETGHVGWFQEYWCLRHAPQVPLRPSLLAAADTLYDSAQVAHATRWSLPLPAVAATLDYLSQVLDAVKARLTREGATPHLCYFVQLAVFHEDMHNEAFDYTLQTHGHAPLPGLAATPAGAVAPCAGDVQIAGGRFLLGAQPGAGFVFDNEKWMHEVEVRPFRMSRTAVSESEFAAFVNDGGYRRHALWCDAGWRWRGDSGVVLPLYWRQAGAGYERRVHAGWRPLCADAAMVHVNWYEAQAYCRWARRRLPSEAEWEFAAATLPADAGGRRYRRYPWGDEAPTAAHANLYGGAGGVVSVNAHAAGDSGWGVRQMFGNAWEWTASTFEPYPGFVRDPYQEYSEPWFGTHKVLRGGCYATAPRLLRNTWRNFYMPERRDVLAGLRTCAAN